MIIHYLKVAFRNLWKYKTQSLISIIGLSVALVCFSICFYVVRSVASADSSYPDSDRMYAVMIDGRFAYMPLTGKLVEDAYPDVESYVTIEFHQAYLFDVGEENTVRQYNLRLLEANPSFIDFFAYPVVSSSLLPSYKEQINGIILFESAAQRIFGKTDVAGEKMICYRGIWEGNEYVMKGFAYTVVGVIEDMEPISFIGIRWMAEDRPAGIFINDELGNLNPDNEVSWTASVSLIKLAKNISAADFEEKFKNFVPVVKNPSHAGMLSRRDGGQPEYSLLPYNQALKKQLDSLYIIIMSVLFTIGILVLAVSIVNYISYTINQFLLKQHECAIRKSVNGNWWQLFFLFYTEIVLTILFAGVLAYAWLTVFAPGYANIFVMFPIELPVLLWHLVQYVLLGIVVSFLCCIIPVTRINNRSVRNTLHGGKALNPKSGIRNVLLGFQLFISVLFIFASLFIHLQLSYVQRITFSTLSQNEKENIIEIKMMYRELLEHKNDIISRLKGNPNIESLLLAGSEITSLGATITGIDYNEKPLAWDSVSVFYVGSNYAEFAKVKLIEGRFMEEGRPNEVVINETARQMLRKENVLGDVIKTYKNQYTIVGVVADEVHLAPSEPMKASFYFPPEETAIIYARINPAKHKETMQFIDDLVREFMPPTLEFSLSTLSENISSLNRLENILFKLVFSFAIISIIISLIGVYSSVQLSTENRRREVAIRKINGADIQNIIRMFLKTYLLILLAASAIAFAIAYYAAHKWLESYVFHTSFSWWLFPLIILVVALLLTATVIYRLLSIARENPADVLKTE